jgi:hypothetical protein
MNMGWSVLPVPLHTEHIMSVSSGIIDLPDPRHAWQVPSVSLSCPQCGHDSALLETSPPQHGHFTEFPLSILISFQFISCYKVKFSTVLELCLSSARDSILCSCQCQPEISGKPGRFPDIAVISGYFRSKLFTQPL